MQSVNDSSHFAGIQVKASVLKTLQKSPAESPMNLISRFRSWQNEVARTRDRQSQNRADAVNLQGVERWPFPLPSSSLLLHNPVQLGCGSPELLPQCA